MDLYDVLMTFEVLFSLPPCDAIKNDENVFNPVTIQPPK
jgi:hypothetical protein